MIVSMNVLHFVKICRVLTIVHQLMCRGVANFGTRCSTSKASCDRWITLQLPGLENNNYDTEQEDKP